MLLFSGPGRYSAYVQGVQEPVTICQTRGVGRQVARHILERLGHDDADIQRMAAAYDARESSAAAAAWGRPGAPGGARDALAIAVTTDPLGVRGLWPVGHYAIEDRGQAEQRGDPYRGLPRGARAKQAALAGPRSWADLSDQDVVRAANMLISMVCEGRRATNRDGRHLSFQQCLLFHGGYVPLAIAARAALLDELALKQLLRSDKVLDGASARCLVLSADGLWIGAAVGSWREAVGGLKSTSEYATYEAALAHYEESHWVRRPPPDLLPTAPFVPRPPKSKKDAPTGPGRARSQQERARSPAPRRGSMGPGRERRQHQQHGGHRDRGYGGSSSSNWWQRW